MTEAFVATSVEPDPEDVTRAFAGGVSEAWRWVPGVAVAGLATAMLMRAGVHFSELIRFAAYWLVGVLLPGLVVARSMLGRRRTIVEDLAVAGATGLALEVVVFLALVSVGLGDIARFWWLPVVLVGIGIRGLRIRWMVRVNERVGRGAAGFLALLAGLLLARLDAVGLGFRGTPLPPNEGQVFTDYWWHLSLVQEMMRNERPQVPQVVGESLNYHFFSHIHVGTASQLSGVNADVVLFRLWFVPIILVSIGLAVALGRQLTNSLTAGVLTAWLSFAVSLGTYVWVGIASFSANPMIWHSPSQVYANVGVLATALGFVALLRRELSRPAAGWLILIVLGSSGAKSTVVPLLIAGTTVVLVWTIVTRAPSFKSIAVAWAGLLGLQGIITVLASGRAGGQVVFLGTLKLLPAYGELVVDDSLRGVNDGLLLDSIDSPRRLGVALIVTTVALAIHAYRLAGVGVLATSSGRRDPVNWWLGGVVLAGYAATLVIDHVGSSQTFFAITVIPLGAAMTVSVLWQLTAGREADRRLLLVKGAAIGCVLALGLEYVLRARQRVGGYGIPEALLWPPALFTVLVVAATLARRTLRPHVGSLSVLVLAGFVGALLPGQAVASLRTLSRAAQPFETAVAETNADYLTSGELESMLWLRENSDDSDVLITNVHCHPVGRAPLCDARGFWVVGLSGRRSVLEGWAYTSESQELQGVGGRIFSQQPSPFVERYELNAAVFERSDVDALIELHDRFDARWIVVANRAGDVPDLPEERVRVRFDNGEMTILEVVDA